MHKNGTQNLGNLEKGKKSCKFLKNKRFPTTNTAPTHARKGRGLLGMDWRSSMPPRLRSGPTSAQEKPPASKLGPSATSARQTGTSYQPIMPMVLKNPQDLQSLVRTLPRPRTNKRTANTHTHNKHKHTGENAGCSVP